MRKFRVHELHPPKAVTLFWVCPSLSRFPVSLVSAHSMFNEFVKEVYRVETNIDLSSDD